jgi:hypothetical protein
MTFILQLLIRPAKQAWFRPPSQSYDSGRSIRSEILCEFQSTPYLIECQGKGARPGPKPLKSAEVLWPHEQTARLARERPSEIAPRSDPAPSFRYGHQRASRYARAISASNTTRTFKSIPCSCMPWRSLAMGCWNPSQGRTMPRNSALRASTRTALSFADEN